MVTKKRAGAISKKLALKGKASLAKAWGGGLEQPLSSSVSLKIISVSSSTLARRGCWLDVDLSFCRLIELSRMQQPCYSGPSIPRMANNCRWKTSHHYWPSVDVFRKASLRQECCQPWTIKSRLIDMILLKLKTFAEESKHLYCRKIRTIYRIIIKTISYESFTKLMEHLSQDITLSPPPQNLR